MTASKTFTYRGKTDTPENLARSLIVAASLQQPGAVFDLKLTTESAMHLGRALEWAKLVADSHEAIRVKHHEIIASREAIEAKAAQAKADLDRALTMTRQSVWWCAGSIAWFTLSLGFWWFA